MSGAEKKLLGRWGEERAARYLTDRGYHIVACGWRCRYGEIDLIARKDTFLAFVEVKLRRSASFAQAREFVDRRKQQRLRTTAELYLSLNQNALQPRFDVIEVYAPQGVNTEQPVINHIKNAF